MPANEKLVLLAIAAHYNGPDKKNIICPGLDRLSRLTGLSGRTIERAFKWLVANNCIAIKRRRNNSNVYTLHRGIVELPRCDKLTDPGCDNLADQDPVDTTICHQDATT